VKSLHKENDFNEMKIRIARLSEDSKRKWGRMNAAQMLCHCNLILQIPLKKIELPEINILFRTIGICTKKEMQIFDNGIPHNMPCFRKVIVNFECDFEQEKIKLLKTLDEYQEAFRRNQLPGRHVLFGKMREKDWGFLEYKHLDHHLKQFSI
jgi:hypothetical protein